MWCGVSSHIKLEKSSFCKLSASSEEHSVTTIAFHHSKASNTGTERKEEGELGGKAMDLFTRELQPTH